MNFCFNPIEYMMAWLLQHKTLILKLVCTFTIEGTFVQTAVKHTCQMAGLLTAT